MDNADPCIEPLKRGNYDSWKIQMKALLVKKDLWEYVSGDLPKPSVVNNNNLEDWEKKDQKAKSELLLSIDGSVLLLLKLQDDATSHDIWKTVYTIFCLGYRSMKLYLLKQLMSPSRMQEGDVRECLVEFYEMLDALSEMGVKIDNSFLCTILLNILPPSFASFKKTIESDDKALPNIQHLGMEILKTLEELEKGSQEVAENITTRLQNQTVQSHEENCSLEQQENMIQLEKRIRDSHEQLILGKILVDERGSQEDAENITTRLQNQTVQSQEKNCSLEQQENMIQLEKRIRDSHEQLMIGKILVDERGSQEDAENITTRLQNQTVQSQEKNCSLEQQENMIQLEKRIRDSFEQLIIGKILVDERVPPPTTQIGGYKPLEIKKVLDKIQACGICRQQGHNRRTCPQSLPTKIETLPSRNVYTCGVCGKEGHNRRTCPLNISAVPDTSSPSKVTYSCGICGGAGHNRTNCPQNTPLAEASTPRRTYSCGICGREGHNRTTCPQNIPLAEASTPRRAYSCGICGREGHSRTTCPQNIPVAEAYTPRRAYSCGICGGEGHNRRTCPLNTPLVTAIPSWSNTPSYSSTSSRSSNIIAAPTVASPRRYTCGLCGGHGHNRRTCSMNY